MVHSQSQFDMLKETVSKILGERVDPQLARDIKATIRSFPEISGAYDLVLHNYGPDSHNGSVHIEIPDTLSADELDKLIRRVQVKVYEEHNVVLTAIGLYSHNTQDAEAIRARETVSRLVTEDPNVLQMHGFNIDTEEKTMRFDIVVSFDPKDREAVYEAAVAKVQKEFPDYSIQAAMDLDLSEVD